MIIPLHDDNELFALDRRRQDMLDRANTVESDDLRNKITGHMCKTERQIAELPVHTLAGIKVKLECIIESLEYGEVDWTATKTSLRTAVKGLDGLAARERLS